MQTQQVPQIDWNDFILQELPEDKRLPFFEGYYGAMNSQLAWLNQNFFNYCYGNPNISLYNPATTYNLNDIVIGSISCRSY